MGTERLFDQIDDLLDQVSAIDVTSSEDTGSLSEFVRERPRTLELLQGGEEVLRQVEERFDAAGFKAPGEAPVASDSLFEIGEMISTEMAAQGLADLAFIARGDLRACFQDLRSADARDFWRLASLIDRALRRLRRGLISVESAMCEFEGRKAPIRVWGDLDTSLEIRRTYGELRREARELDTSEGPDLEQRVRRMADRLAELASHRIYPLLRVEDRQEIRRLHRRMRRWLRNREREDPESGRRLWQDIVSFFSLLGAVNQRQELRQHDRSLINRAYKDLFGRRGVAFLSDALLMELRALEGLDEELDELLLRPDDHPLGTWRKPLDRLRASLMSPQREVLSPFV